VIRSFANSATRRFYELGRPSGFRGLDVTAAHELLATLDSATNLTELGNLRSVGLHKLKGDRRGQWAMTINRRWRLCFEFRDGDAFNVEIVDYQGMNMPVAVHPGRLLRREMAARKLSANRLALELGVPSGRITDIVNGKRGITADTALRLARRLGTTPQFWMNFQTRYDLLVAQEKLGRRLTIEVRAA